MARAEKQQWAHPARRPPGIPAEDGGDLYLVNGNMCKLADAGIFSGQETTDTPTQTEEEETTSE